MSGLESVGPSIPVLMIILVCTPVTNAESAQARCANRDTLEVPLAAIEGS